jgi:WD40 repeat protein
LINLVRLVKQDEAMARDMRRLTGFGSAISQSAAHIYLSALAFSPRNSAVSKQYRQQYPGALAIEIGGLGTWWAIQNVLEGHSRPVAAVAFSPDGNRIVSGSFDNSIRVWDAETGEVVAGPFIDQSGSVTSVAFSPDGKRIVSGSYGKTILVWDAGTGEVVVGPFKGHSRVVWSVAFSPDGNWIVSGSGDSTIRVWNAETGEVVAGPFDGHGSSINSVAFSPDGKRVVSGSEDTTIRVWDAMIEGSKVSSSHKPKIC